MLKIIKYTVVVLIIMQFILGGMAKETHNSGVNFFEK